MFKKLKDHLIPHEGNNHSPKLLEAEGIATLLLVVMLLQVTFVAHTALLKNSNFLAAVLPTVLVTMTNIDRAEAGVSTLQSDAVLASAAQAKANDMAARGYFAHRDPDGRDPWYWFDKAGYIYSYAGENLAVDFNESKDVEKAWMNSPAHKANIMKGKFTKVGIGVAKGVYEGRETTFVVQFFATPPAPVAVVPEPVVAAVSTKPVAESIAPKPVVTKQKLIKTVKKVKTIAKEVAPETFIATENPVKIDDGQVLGEAFIPISVSIDDAANTSSVKEQSNNQEQRLSQNIIQKDAQEPSYISNATATFIELASSPSEWYMPVLIALFALFMIVLGLTFHAHTTKREVESVILATFVLVLLAGLVNFNFGGSSTSALVPSDGQYASASIVFEDGFYYQD